MPVARLQQQLQFILEIDKLKAVLRRAKLIADGRRENSAEHSWHVALMALTLIEYANEPVDPLHVVKMLLVHDVVEIDAGDTYAFDPSAHAGQHQREDRAAGRIFGLLPADQAAEYRALWEEFDACISAEARLANSVDRLMPLLHNVHERGRTWQEHGVTKRQVMQRMAVIAQGSETLWRLTTQLVEDAVAQGFLAAD